MHTVGSRANTIVYYGAMVLLVALMANVATSYFCFSYDVPNIDVKLNKIDKFKKENKRGIEQDVATIVFDLQADLRPLFNWNTKLLFVYVTAEYETKKHKKNCAVLWDMIVQDKELANLNFNALYNEYPLLDQGTGLGANNITLSLNYNLVPITGLLFWNTPYNHKFTFPKTYHSK